MSYVRCEMVGPDVAVTVTAEEKIIRIVLFVTAKLNGYCFC